MGSIHQTESEPLHLELVDVSSATGWCDSCKLPGRIRQGFQDPVPDPPLAMSEGGSGEKTGTCRFNGERHQEEMEKIQDILMFMHFGWLVLSMLTKCESVLSTKQHCCILKHATKKPIPPKWRNYSF